MIDAAIAYDGFEDAFIGMATRCASEIVAVYDMRKMIDICISRDGMTAEDAEDHIYFNYLGAYVGVHTPYIVTVRADEIDDIA